MMSDETPYYCVERTPVARGAGGSWRVRATIRRKDSGEVVDQIIVRRGESAEAVRRRLDEALHQRLSILRKPEDWGKSAAVTALIDRFLATRDRAYGYHLKAEEAKSPEARTRIVLEGRAWETREMEALKRDVAALGESEKVDLANPTAYQTTHNDDPWVLDILSAKQRLLGLIDTPSPEVKAGQRALHALLNQVKPSELDPAPERTS